LPAAAARALWTNSLDQFFPGLWSALPIPHFR